MAFNLPLEIGDTGVCAAYWRITHVQLDRNAGIVEATLHGYRDEAARREDKAPMQRLAFRLQQARMANPDSVSMDELYRAIREEPAGGEAPAIFAAASDI